MQPEPQPAEASHRELGLALARTARLHGGGPEQPVLRLQRGRTAPVLAVELGEGDVREDLRRTDAEAAAEPLRSECSVACALVRRACECDRRRAPGPRLEHLRSELREPGRRRLEQLDRRLARVQCTECLEERRHVCGPRVLARDPNLDAPGERERRVCQARKPHDARALRLLRGEPRLGRADRVAREQVRDGETELRGCRVTRRLVGLVPRCCEERGGVATATFEQCSQSAHGQPLGGSESL